MTKMEVPLVDLRASYQEIREEVLAAIDEVLQNMQLMLGPNQEALEQEFAAYCQAEHGIAVSSGTDALFAALTALGIGPGDEVIAPSHTFFATLEAIVHTGATPVMVDVEPGTLTIDPERVREALTEATRAIVPVHLYGHPADMESILAIALEHDLRVVEDAAQAHGARYRGRRCGGLGDAGCFSFYFTKNLGAFGEAGFVAARDAGIAERIRLLRHHGHVSKFEHEIVGHNLRMDELQAAVLRIKLRGLDAALERRRAVARRYGELFAGTPVVPLESRPDCEPAHHLYPIRVAASVAERDELMSYLAEQGIGTGIHYRIPGHLQRALRNRPHRCGGLEVTEAACRELLSLPIFPELRDDQVEYVAEHVLRFCQGRAHGARARSA